MQIQIGEWLEALRAGIGLVPPALVAVVLLGGPTAGWLLYRFVVQPRARRIAVMNLSAMWVCSKCRSVNELRMTRCYRCDARPDETDLELIDAYPSGPARLTAVGPGLDLGGPGRPMARPRSFDSSAPFDPAAPPHLMGMPYLAVVPDPYREPDSLTVPDLAAMTEVADVPRRRRSARSPDSEPVGPEKPEVTPPRRAVMAGQTPGPDDPPAA